MNIELMNTPYSNKNHPNFCAFEKPKKEVIRHFAKVIDELTPENRKLFTDAMDKIVKSAADCPVPIGHEMVSGYTEYYSPVVRGCNITTNKKHNCNANYIIDVMQKAVDFAKNKADSDVNIRKMLNIFGVDKI